MNQLVIDPNHLSLTESQIAALVVDENVVGSVHLNIDILRQFKLTNRLVCKILCALCEISPGQPNNGGGSSGNSGGASGVGGNTTSSSGSTSTNGGLSGAGSVGGAGQQTGDNGGNGGAGNAADLLKGGADINNFLSLSGRQDLAGTVGEIDLFAEYCRQNWIQLAPLLQTFDDEDFISDRIFRNTNFVLQQQKHSSVPPLASFQRFWQFCSNLASTDKSGLGVITRVFFSQVWQHNQAFQLNFIANCIEQNLIPRILNSQSPHIQANNLVPYSDLLKCQPDFETIPELNNWKFHRLYQILIDFTVPGNIQNLQVHSNCYARVLELFSWPLQYCPDLAVLGLLGVSGQVSGAKVEILSLAIPTFLNASHPNAVIILHSIWSNGSSDQASTTLVQHKSNTPLTWSQKTLLQALSDHYTKSPQEEQQQRLSRILDVAQDIKTLFRLLDGTCYPFVIDLACLASRREYLKLDKWLKDKFTENGENFIRAVYSFLTKRYLPLLSGTNMDSTLGPLTMGGPTLPAETLVVILNFLNQCVTPPTGQLSVPFTELSQGVKKDVDALLRNSEMLLQRAPRQPPPGVVASMANDYGRDRLGGFAERPMSDLEKLQAEFEAKRIGQRVQRPIMAQNAPMVAPVTRPSIANKANIGNLLAAGSSENHSVPPEVIQDKVSFIVNNLSLINLNQKADEFKALFGNDETYYGWTAQYFSTKRAAMEQNFQPLYANFLYELKNPKLIEAVIRETYRNIKHLLRLDKKSDNINDRALLKSLGQWIGLLTLARNRPILHVDLDLKGLLVEAYRKGVHELFYVVPFLAEILRTTLKSKIFKPNNPFVLGLLRALVELKSQPNLKLNLEFEVEVLFKDLGVDLNKVVVPNHILSDDKYFSKIECQLGPKQVPGQQPMKSQPQQSQVTGPQIGHGMNSMVMRSNEFGASLSPLNTPPLMAAGNSSLHGQVGPNLPTGAAAATSPVSWASKLKYSDLNINNTASLNNLITIQPSLGIFNLQPNLRAAVRPAFELSISDWLPSILEKTLKICLPTAEQIIKKDFALDPDETHMQRGAHCLVRHLVSYMAMILSREPEQLEQSLINNLKVAFTRACPSLRKEQAEHAATIITADNLELARAFIIKTAIERALADIDKLLQNDYELRRAAHFEGHQYFDPAHLAFHSKFVNDGLRLKPAPLVTDQMRSYDEIGQNVAGFKRFDPPYNEPASIGTTSPFNELGQNLNIPPVVNTTSNMGANMVNQLISSQGPEVFLELLMQNQLTDDSFLDEQLVALTEASMNPTLAIRFIHRFRAHLTDTSLPKTLDLLSRMKSMASQPLSIELQACIEVLQSANRSQSNYIVQPAIGTSGSFSSASPQMQATSNALVQQREVIDGDPPALIEKTERLLRGWVNIHQSGQIVKMFPVFVQQMTAHGILETDDLVKRFFRLSTEMCVESCYRLLATQPNGANSLELRNKCYETLDAFTMLIVLLIKNSGSSSASNLRPEPTTKINLLSKILSIIANVAIKDQKNRRSEFQHLAYYRILILLFIELNLSPPMLSLPLQNFNNFGQVQPNPDVIAENVQYPVLSEFTKTLRILGPSYVPSFAFAWLDFLSHPLFVEKCLYGKPSNRPLGSVYKGWSLYAQLLIDLIEFEAPFLRNVELPPSVDLLYKGTLKMFLVLLHDFPEFLCEYCYSLCDVIPCNAIQLRNLVLSAFPRKMRLPDPFTPNLKIDLLPEMAQPPKTGALQTNLINSSPFKDELDSYLRTRNPSYFITKLPSYLKAQSQPLVSLNVPLLNALVLYVGQSAISALAPRQINTDNIAGTPHMDVLQHLTTTLDTEGRYLFLNAIANQLRYPNSHTHYFRTALLHLFSHASSEQIQEQITRVLVERLIIMRPHPWGLLVTFIELIKNEEFMFWDHEFVRCAPEITKLFESVARSCCVRSTGSSQKGK